MGDISEVSILSAHAINHKSGGNDTIRIDELAAAADNTNLNATTGAHGLLKKLDNSATHYLNGQGSFVAIAAGDLPLHATNHRTGGTDSIKLDDLVIPDDNTDLDATTARHGLLPKLGGGVTNFLRADGSWAVPTGDDEDLPPVVYDPFATVYDLVAEDTLSPNGKWRLIFRGQSPPAYEVFGPGTGVAAMGTGTSIRYGIEVNTASSVLVGFPVSSFTPRLRRQGTPTGNVTALIRDSTDAVVATFSQTIAATSLSTTFADVFFTLPSPYTLAAGDRILVEYSGALNTVSIEIFITDQFDAALTRRTRFDGTVYSESDTTDICGTVGGNDLGQVGVRVPAAPTNGFPRVFYEYPYSTAYGGSSTSASLVLTESSPFTDFDIELYVRTIDQLRTSPNTWETVWFMFRYTDSFHHYYITLKSNGTIELGKKDNLVSIDEQYFLHTTATIAWTANVWNKLRVRAEGTHFMIWVDDTLEIDIDDDGSLGAQGGAPNTPAVPTATLLSGLFGLYNEDAEVEFGPMTISPLSTTSASDPVITYTNAGADYGVGIILEKTQNDLPFKGIAPGSDKISIIDNLSTSSVEIDVVEANLNKELMAGGILNRTVGTQDVVNNALETTIFEAMIPGNRLGIDKMLRLTLNCDYLGNAAVARTLTVKIKYGGVTLYHDATNGLTIDAARRAVRMVIELMANGATNAQALGGVIWITDAGGTTAGLGDIADDESISGGFIGGLGTVDSTLPGRLEVTVQHSGAADANVSFRRHTGLLEII